MADMGLDVREDPSIETPVMEKAAAWASISEAPARRRASSRNSGSERSGGENWPSGVER